MSASDKLRKASGSTRPVVTTLSLPKSNGATTAELTSATGWNTTTGTDVVIYRRQLNTTTGLYEKVDGTQTDWTAQLTGTTLSGMVLQAGTEPASGYAADGNTVVLAGPTAQWADDLIETLLTLFNQDQSLKSAPIQTALGLGAANLNGWNALGFTFNTVTALGNGSYQGVINGQDVTSTVSSGMRLRTTRTVAAPTQSTSLNGTTQYYSKISPAGMTFTTSWVTGGWIKLTSYALASIFSRYNGTSGWDLHINATGTISVIGYNAGAANFRGSTTYQSIPLNKWVHIAAQMDMTTSTNSPTTNYVMLNGVDIPLTVAGGGTGPSAIIQAGNLEVGSTNGGTQPFPGKIAQAFVFSAKVTQATIRGYMSQTLAGTETSLISAYSFNNSINDLNTTNANNLTANGSAVATNADSPFGGQAGGTISSTLDYAEIVDSTFSTNTTVTMRVPHTNTIPTTGGVSAVVYSSAAYPYGWPVKGKLSLGEVVWCSNQSTTATTFGTQVTGGTMTVTCPTGGQKLIIRVTATPFLPAAGVGILGLFDGATQIGQYNSSGNNTATLVVPYYATGGSHTFSLQMYETSAGTLIFGAGTTTPAVFTIYEAE